MAALTPIPQTNSDVLQSNDNIFTLLWRNYFSALDGVVRGIAPAILAPSTSSPGASTGLITLTNSLTANVALNNSTFTDGPSVAQGTKGTWFASGSVSVQDIGVTASNFGAKLWDGTTVIASGSLQTNTTGMSYTLSFSGIITNPAGNIRISGITSGGAAPRFLASSVLGGANGSVVTAIRIG